MLSDTEWRVLGWCLAGLIVCAAASIVLAAIDLAARINGAG